MKESTLLLEKEESQATPGSAAKLIREVKYKTRKRVSSEDKIRIVLEGFRQGALKGRFLKRRYKERGKALA